MDDAVAAEAEGVEGGLTDNQWQMNYLWTVLLDLGLFLLTPVLLLYGTLGLGACDGGRACDAQWVVVGSIVLVWGALGGFVLTVGLSIVLLVRHKLSFYVPIVGGTAMVCCVTAALNIAWSGT